MEAFHLLREQRPRVGERPPFDPFKPPTSEIDRRRKGSYLRALLDDRESSIEIQHKLFLSRVEQNDELFAAANTLFESKDGRTVLEAMERAERASDHPWSGFQSNLKSDRRSVPGTGGAPSASDYAAYQRRHYEKEREKRRPVRDDLRAYDRFIGYEVVGAAKSLYPALTDKELSQFLNGSPTGNRSRRASISKSVIRDAIEANRDGLAEHASFTRDARGDTLADLCIGTLRAKSAANFRTVEIMVQSARTSPTLSGKHGAALIRAIDERHCFLWVAQEVERRSKTELEAAFRKVAENRYGDFGADFEPINAAPSA